MKRILVAALVIIILAVPAAASDLPDLNMPGSICITISYDGKPVAGGELTLYRVGDIVEVNGNYNFELIDRFDAINVTSENLLNPETAQKLSDHISRKRITGTTEKIGTKGTITFDDLKPGLYLVVQNKAASGYQKLNPFLVSLPMRQMNGYAYHVDASPKISLMPNSPGNTEQPQTGQAGWPIWLFLISSTALALLLKRKKHC